MTQNNQHPDAKEEKVESTICTFGEPAGLSMANLKEAIKLLKEPKTSLEQFYSVIASIGKMINAETFVSKYLPKGKIIIGTGEPMQFNPPQNDQT